MRIWNTLSGRKEELTKPEGRPLHLFVCGPTVYDYSHVGHARTYIIFDAFVRFLRHKNWKVFYLQNITNVDDKIITRAKEEKRNPLELARCFTKEYLADMDALKITSVDKYASASKFISQIVKQVRALKNKDFAYEIEDDGIYFDIGRFPNYGKLSGRTVAQAEDGVSRIDESIKKHNRGDFCLWKFPKSPAGPNFLGKITGFFVNSDGEPMWKTALGWGRPGWHIEDTAITESFFGPQYDIHGAALDLKFPHHEAEIAQQESASGKSPLASIWMHAGFLTIGGKKMSKSLGNFITIRDLLKIHRPDAIRWLFLGHHYRTPMDYTPELVTQFESIFAKTRIFLEKLDFVSAGTGGGRGLGVGESIRENWKNFGEALEDDFNTPLALAALLKITGEFQEKVWDMKPEDARELRKHLADSLEILGINVETAPVPAKIRKIAAERELCRVSKQFVKSDTLREKIRMLGYSIEDTPHGPFVYKP